MIMDEHTNAQEEIKSVNKDEYVSTYKSNPPITSTLTQQSWSSVSFQTQQVA